VTAQPKKYPTTAATVRLKGPAAHSKDTTVTSSIETRPDTAADQTVEAGPDDDAVEVGGEENPTAAMRPDDNMHDHDEEAD
jgi:hypothetical protein